MKSDGWERFALICTGLFDKTCALFFQFSRRVFTRMFGCRDLHFETSGFDLYASRVSPVLSETSLCFFCPGTRLVLQDLVWLRTPCLTKGTWLIHWDRGARG